MNTVAEILREMVSYFNGNRQEVNHMLKVWSYARTIGIMENLDEETLQTLEIAAIVHDIACPLCRQKYGSVSGRLQEKEGPQLVHIFLRNSGLPQQMIDRIAYLVGHHHTLENVEGADYQILIEADYLVNADESKYSAESIREFEKLHFRTTCGREFLEKNFSIW